VVKLLPYLFFRLLRLKSLFLILFFAFCCLSVSANDAVRISVFWLYDIKTIRASAVDSEITIHRNNTGDDTALPADQTLVVEFHDDNLNFRLVDQSGRTIQSWIDTSAILKGRELSGLVSLTIPGKITRSFRGQIRISTATNTSSSPKTGIRVVLETDKESAVAAITASEMPVRNGKSDLEALKSLTVVVRTFMASHQHRHESEGYDFCDSTHCQHYQGEDFASGTAGRLANIAARETHDTILSFQHKPIEAYFTAACGGRTTTPEIAWGTATSGAFKYQPVVCKWCRASHYYRWERTIGASRLFTGVGTLVDFKLTSHAELKTENAAAGFVRAIVVTDGTRTASIPISRFRSELGHTIGWNTIISNAFSIERRGSEFVVRGRGFGHNVGLCIEGALRQSERGRDWKTILGFYFPHSEISPID